MEEHWIPDAQSQYIECVYLGGYKKVMTGMAAHGINWNIMHNRRSLNVLQPTSNPSSAENMRDSTNKSFN